MSHADLRRYIRTYDQDLDANLCQQMIGSFAGLERFQLRNGRGIRRGLEDSAWTELNVSRLSDPAFMGMFRRIIDRALERYNRDIELAIPIPNSPQLANLTLKRYRPGHREQFQLHWDSINHVANRYLVLLWYLNDVELGGETRFPQLDVTVSARAGRLLMFPPYWMYQHEGLPPLTGDKYILSTYLLFIDPSNPNAANSSAVEG
ncbi:2OG-Fe(II) oxygenase [Steroidobacter sp.]|uniref:2OG-Fe(II) oxygenase n=1 Tax=Steroidobacter sp. TaxID=1978227 RepID=UPI001A5D7DFA|nr:2OG-Fe(II) oxygenase [Steroidobacter sp.]MBL8269679.1 2OG-Fe(II) oxygenase [Steroidobacter sp.]